MAGFDQSVFGWVWGFARQGFVLDNLGIFLAAYLPYLLVSGFLIFIFKEKSWRCRLLFFINGVLAVMLSRGIITETVRFFYHRLRPFEFLNFASLVSESDGSFPSGHAAFFFALATIVYFINHRWGTWYFILAAVNGLSRVFVGVHWPLDIVGGAALGILCGLLVYFTLKPHWLMLAAGPDQPEKSDTTPS